MPAPRPSFFFIFRWEKRKRFIPEESSILITIYIYIYIHSSPSPFFQVNTLVLLYSTSINHFYNVARALISEICRQFLSLICPRHTCILLFIDLFSLLLPLYTRLSLFVPSRECPLTVPLPFQPHSMSYKIFAKLKASICDPLTSTSSTNYPLPPHIYHWFSLEQDCSPLSGPSPMNPLYHYQSSSFSQLLEDDHEYQTISSLTCNSTPQTNSTSSPSYLVHFHPYPQRENMNEADENYKRDDQVSMRVCKLILYLCVCVVLHVVLAHS